MDDLVAQAVGYATLGVCLAAYEHWLANPGVELGDVLDAALGDLAAGFVARR